MWVRKYLLFFLLLSQAAFSQTLNAQKLLGSVNHSASFIAVDDLDQVYLVTSRNELLKYNSTGKLLWSYSNKNFGKLIQVDVSDPFRLVLYYPDFQQFIVLNNNLDEIGRHSFNNNPSRLITLIAAAKSGGYWAYDQSNRELIRFNVDFTEAQKSGNIFQLTGSSFQAERLVADEQNVYLKGQKYGILQFDRFGGYLKTIQVDEADHFQVQENSIVCLRNNALQKINIQTYEKTSLNLPVQQGVKQVVIGNKIMALLTEKGVFLYAL